MVLVNTVPAAVPVALINVAPIINAPIALQANNPNAIEGDDNVPDPGDTEPTIRNDRGRPPDEQLPGAPGNGNPANGRDINARPPSENLIVRLATPEDPDELPDYESSPLAPNLPPINLPDLMPNNEDDLQQYDEDGNPIDPTGVIDHEDASQQYNDDGNPIDPTDAVHKWGWNDPGPSQQESTIPMGDEEFTDSRDEAGIPQLVWQKAKDLGNGAFGAVSAWVLYDKRTNNVLDRMAVKHVVTDDRHWSAEENEMWYDWPNRQLPSEVVAHRILSGKSPFLVGYKGWRMYTPEARTYRIGLSPAEYGDAQHFVKSLCRADDGDGTREPHEIARMPAIFFLDMLASVMSAGQTMYAEKMIHNDIKLANILLACDHEDGDGMKTWVHVGDAAVSKGWGVKPVLTDFGLTRPVQCRAFRNPSDLLDCGTNGTRPPEQAFGGIDEEGECYSIMSEARRGDAVDEKAMIFSIAAAFFVVSTRTFTTVSYRDLPSN
jgi:hypothetical protein